MNTNRNLQPDDRGLTESFAALHHAQQDLDRSVHDLFVRNLRARVAELRASLNTNTLHLDA
jgi:hypothetical protein